MKKMLKEKEKKREKEKEIAGEVWIEKVTLRGPP